MGDELKAAGSNAIAARWGRAHAGRLTARGPSVPAVRSAGHAALALVRACFRLPARRPSEPSPLERDALRVNQEIRAALRDMDARDQARDAAEPKVATAGKALGKGGELIGLLRELVNARDARYAGRIADPRIGERTWRECLHRAGLSDDPRLNAFWQRACANAPRGRPRYSEVTHWVDHLRGVYMRIARKNMDAAREALQRLPGGSTN